jgi:hypothetical protein
MAFLFLVTSVGYNRLMRVAICLYIILVVFSASCAHRENPPLFEIVNDSGIDFNNRVEDGKLEKQFFIPQFL